MKIHFKNTRVRKTLGLKKQQGLTLIELMIASTLGIMLIGGMYTLFAVNKESVRVLSNVSQAQQKANFALEVMAEDVQMAGWPGVFDATSSDPFGVRENGTFGLFGVTARYDTFVVSRRGRAALPGNANPLLAQNELDCIGNPVPTNTALVHRYFVNPDTKELICQSLPSGQMQTIIGNVEGFKVLYGVDTVRGQCDDINPDASPRDAIAECMSPTTFLNGSALVDAFSKAAVEFLDGSHLRPIKTIKLAIAVSTEESDIIDRDLGLARSNFYLLGQNYQHGFQGAMFDEGRVIKYSLRTVSLRQALRGP